jgi:hypothetical protein
MNKVTIVQMFKENEPLFLIDYGVPMIRVMTKKGDSYRLDNIKTEGNLTTAILYYDEWRFDKARNLAKKLVDTEYVFTLDADEEIVYFNFDKWTELNHNSYNVTIANLTNELKYTNFEATRLFKTKFDYFGWAHERPLINTPHIMTDILVRHIGYANPEVNQNKYKRNADLILKSGLALTDEYQREKLKQTLNKGI